MAICAFSVASSHGSVQCQQHDQGSRPRPATALVLPPHFHSPARRQRKCCRPQPRSMQRASQSAPLETLAGEWMEDIYDQLADRLLQRTEALPASQKYIVGVAGVPGSGKTTLVHEVCRRINQQCGADVAVVVPMDGFHYYRRELDAIPDPEQAHARRGAPWTFDAAAYVACIRQARETGACSAPSFDHGVGDPVPGAISVTPTHRVLLSEGNYLLLAEAPWDQLQQLFDEVWYVDCDIEEAMQRVYARQTGHGVAPDVSRRRINTNDRPNAELIATTRQRAGLTVPPLPLRSLIHESSDAD